VPDLISSRCPKTITKKCSYRPYRFQANGFEHAASSMFHLLILYNDQRNAQVFNLFILFTSSLHVSGFLLAHLQRQVCSFSSDSSLLGMVSAPGSGPYPGALNHCRSCKPVSENGLKGGPKHVRQM
jgi:hypothetical protein